MWRLRRGFWNWLATFKYRHNKPLVIPPPVAGERPIEPVPFTSKFPRIPIAGIVVADHVPHDEVQTLPLRFCQLQAGLYRVLSPMQAGAPEIDVNTRGALQEAYTPAHVRCFPAPARPPEYDGDIDLGHLSVASPYACYLERTEGDGYRWDLTGLGAFECHGGLLPPVALVEFGFDNSQGRLVPVRVDCELGSCRPGEHDWTAAQRIAMCAVTTHLSLVRHFNWIHLVCGGPLAISTRNCLPLMHPVKRLLWPHIFATQSSNEMVTLDQMTPGGDFESIFSFTHNGMCELFEATCGDFDLRMIDPEVDATRRGLTDAPFGAPALTNRMALMTVIRDHVRRFLALYFGPDDGIAQDGPFLAWLDDLRARVPHGVIELAGSPANFDGAVMLLSTLIYLTTVEHEIVGSGVWNYQLWPDAQPVRVYRGGARLPQDVYQRLVNANFNLNVHRTPLMSDFSACAVDDRGAEAFRRFRHDLAALQRSMDNEPSTCWRIEPRMLKANINA
jgi:Lipoxygenase